MGSELWWIWMIVAAVFVVGEIFTAGFFLLWFGIGAAVAGILALIGLNSAWQWSIFVIVSGVLFAISRRFAERFTKKQPLGIGADRIVGTKGVVVERIDNAKNAGRVRIEREEWRAEGDSDEVIPKGVSVKIIGVKGAHVVVRALEEKEGK